MLRQLATALICTLSAIIAVAALYDLFADANARAPEQTVTAKRPQVHGHVRAIARSEPFGLFVAVSPVPASRHEQKAILAFDPDLFRGGRIGEPLSPDEICEVVEEVAAEHDLSVPLFTRLIWQESRFRNETVSRAGAQGIAQFMPETAAERGLDDPFDPLQALPASADFLSDLVERFGNFGLAAAAYNSGPRRVKDWLAGRGRLPKETRDYVLRITGRKAEHWAKSAAHAEPHPEAIDVRDCNVRPIRAALLALASKSARKQTWGVQLAGSWSEKKALATYARLSKKYPQILGKRWPKVVAVELGGKSAAKQTLVRVAADTRSEAEELCKRLKEAGGICTVTRNPA